MRKKWHLSVEGKVVLLLSAALIAGAGRVISRGWTGSHKLPMRNPASSSVLQPWTTKRGEQKEASQSEAVQDGLTDRELQTKTTTEITDEELAAMEVGELAGMAMMLNGAAMPETLGAGEDSLPSEAEDSLMWLQERGVKLNLKSRQTLTRAEFIQILYELWGSWLTPEQAKKLANTESVNKTPRDNIPLEVDEFYQLLGGITTKPLSETEIDLRTSEPLLKWELGAELYWFLQSWGYNIPYGRPEAPMTMALATAEAEKTLREICGGEIEKLVENINLEDARIANRELLVEAARDGARLLEKIEVGADTPLDQPITAAELAKALLKLERMSLGGKYPSSLKAYADHVSSGP